MDFPIIGCTDDSPADDTYNYIGANMGVNWGTPESARQCPISENVRLVSMTVVLTNVPGAGTSRTITVRKNGVDTLATMTISGTNRTNTISIEVDFVPGDKISLRHTQSGAPAASGIIYWWFTARTESKKALMFGASASNPSTVAGTPSYGNIFTTTWSTTANANDIPVPIVGSFTKLAVLATTAPGAGKSYAVSVRHNNATDVLTVTLSDAATEGSASGSQALALGDNIQIKSNPTGTPDATLLSWCVTFEPTTNGETFFGFGSNIGATTSTTVVYEQALGTGNSSYASGTAARRLRLPTCTLKNLRVRLAAAPGGLASRTIGIGWDASVALTTTITGAATTGADNSTFALTQNVGSSGGMLLSNQSSLTAPSSTSGQIHASYGVVMAQPPVENNYGYVI